MSEKQMAKGANVTKVAKVGVRLNHQHGHKRSTEPSAGPTNTSSSQPITSDLVRFSVAMPEHLLMDFDQLVAHRGLAKNRSEVVRDLVREALIESRSAMPGTNVMGTLTIVYDHHTGDLQDKLHHIQHEFCDNVVSTMHVHVDSHTCLEVIVLRGETTLVQQIANMISGTKGVQTGKLVLATVDQ